MQQYPYFAPQVLTDAVFTQYGGQTGTSTAAQRQDAYLLAEEQMTEHLSSFLVPTTITGSAWFLGGSLLETEFGHIQRVFSVSMTKVLYVNPLTTDIVTGSALVRNAEYGYVDAVFAYYPCSFYLGYGYSTQMVYESGLSSGTVTQPSILAGLTVAAQINLNEMDASLSNEGVADVGVQRFANQSYTEDRKYLKRTAFGNSAMAQRAARLTEKYRSKPAFGFR